MHKGEAPVRVILRAQVLSLLDKGRMPLDIADFLDLYRTTPYRIEILLGQQVLDSVVPDARHISIPLVVRMHASRGEAA
jgi:hypothetical protein